MGLSSALNIAQSALATTSAQTAVVSRNIAGVNNPNYSLKTAQVTTNYSGASQVVGITRAANPALFTNLLGANAASQYQQAIANGLNQLQQTIGTTSSSTTSSTSATSDISPSTMINNLSNALQQYAAAPDNASMGQAAVAAAQSLATTLNGDSTTVQSVRAQADSAMATSVQTINGLLSRFQTVNSAIISGTQTGADVTDDLDTRDQILSQLSNQIGITTSTAANGGMSIYTDSGVTLFDQSPRSVTFDATPNYAPGTTGNAVVVDGVPVTGSSSVMSIQSGQLAGLADLRDTVTFQYQNQLDQIAGGVINAFSESDQTGGNAPTVPGLFTYAGAPAMPSSGSITGLAASISVSANVDPTKGGNVTLLRNGGISDPTNPAYNYNTAGDAAYSGRLQGLLTAMSQTQTYDGSTGGASSGSLTDYATSSVSWLEAARQSATNQVSYTGAVVSTTTTALSNTTGVNLDDELSKMIDLEHSYQASAQLMNSVNTMYTALFQDIPSA
jgi:flagellar hook-associated protein 1 FlgK